MRTTTTYTLAASLVAGVAAAGHQHHGHQHFHARNEASKMEKRDPEAVVEYVQGPTEVVYELNGELLQPDDVAEAIKNGEYIVVGETTPTFSPPPPPPKPTTTSADLGAQFLEKPSTTSAPPTSTAAPSPSAPAPPPSGGDSASGVDVPFPDGTVKCSELPTKYGAVNLDWLDFGGWSGLQFVPDFTEGALSISSIITGIAGDTCSEGCMCSYACPPGYQKTQWPSAQGSTKESIGGLYCNSEGYLELTRKEYDTLCEPGEGGVSIQNDLDVEVSTCRTDYPGTESMVIPAVAYPGSSVALCNPSQTNYYQWDGMSTTAQYYVNPKGYTPEEGCVWNSPKGPLEAGNWAPIIIGVGKAEDGITYLSIFQNAPTSTAKLDFNIEIKGDVNTKCAYIDGQWIGGSSGCTTGMPSGGKAVFRYF